MAFASPVRAVPGVPWVSAAAAPAGVGGGLRAQIDAGLQGIQSALVKGQPAAVQAARDFLARPELNFGPVVNPFVAAYRQPAPVIAGNGAVKVHPMVLPGLPTGPESGIPILHELLRDAQYQNLVPVFIRLWVYSKDVPEAEQLVLYDLLYGQSELLRSSKVLDDEQVASLSEQVRQQQGNKALLMATVKKLSAQVELRKREATAAVALADQRGRHLDVLGNRVEELVREGRGRSNSDPVSVSSFGDEDPRPVSPSGVVLDARGTGAAPTVAAAAALALGLPQRGRGLDIGQKLAHVGPLWR